VSSWLYYLQGWLTERTLRLLQDTASAHRESDMHVPTVSEIIQNSERRFRGIVYADTNLRNVAYTSPFLHDTWMDAQLDAVHAATQLDNTRAYPRTPDTHCACCAADTIHHHATVHGDVVGVCSWACADRLDNIWRPRKMTRPGVSWATLSSLVIIGACIIASVL